MVDNLKENFEFPMKDLSLIGKRIYNTKTNRHGMITGITLENHVGNLTYHFNAYYDKIEFDSMIFAEDLHNGNIRFVIIDMPEFKDYKEKEISDIKEFMGEKFCANSIIHINREQHKKNCAEQEFRGILEIMGKANELDSIAADIVQDNYSMLKYFTLFIDGIITENQMLYGLVNVLSSELRNKKDEELKGFREVLNKEMESLLKETIKEWIEKNPEKYLEVMEGLNKDE